ncbi:MAG TPA: sigma-70 family RNA polymerase sigma factor [Candidatus Acidoferrales bacterium]|nr:sigma-70 family RNA polymerase sigma factor [Candidatus Acidoferrales bacterium]
MIFPSSASDPSPGGEPALNGPLAEHPEDAKMASSAANQRPSGASMSWEPGDRLGAGADRPTRGAETEGGEGSGRTNETMGMSVALEGDARQAAAVRLAEEHALVRKAQSGDRLAFEDLVRRYDRDVLRLALHLVHRPEEAQDIYQEAFLRVYRNLHRFRFECSFYTWLYRIVTNVSLDHLRRRTSHREEQAPVAEGTEGGIRDFFDRQAELRAAADPEKNLLGQELGQHIQEAIKRLSPRERLVFEMKHFQGLRLRAIGDLLGTSEETAKNSLFRATRKLRESLASLR